MFIFNESLQECTSVGFITFGYTKVKWFPKSYRSYKRVTVVATLFCEICTKAEISIQDAHTYQ